MENRSDDSFDDDSWFKGTETRGEGIWLPLTVGFICGFLVMQIVRAPQTVPHSQAPSPLLLCAEVLLIALAFILAVSVSYIIAEKFFSSGKFLPAKVLIDSVMSVDRFLRMASAERARLLVLHASTYLALSNNRGADKLLREVLDIIKYRKNSIYKVFGETVLAEAAVQILDRDFAGIEAISSLDLAWLNFRNGQIAKAQLHCQTALSGLQEFRSQTVRKMTVEECRQKPTIPVSRWTALSKLSSQSEKLASIDSAIADAQELRLALRRATLS